MCPAGSHRIFPRQHLVLPGGIPCPVSTQRANPNNCLFTGPDRARPGEDPPVTRLDKKIYLRG